MQRRISIKDALRQLQDLLPGQRDVAKTTRLSQLQIISFYHSYVTKSLIFQHCQYRRYYDYVEQQNLHRRPMSHIQLCTELGACLHSTFLCFALLLTFVVSSCCGRRLLIIYRPNMRDIRLLNSKECAFMDKKKNTFVLYVLRLHAAMWDCLSRHCRKRPGNIA